MQKPPVPDLSETALLLDIDGTLVEHAAHPDAVTDSPDLLHVLDDLNQKLDGAIAFVTGRNLAMVDRLFGQTGLAAAGRHVLAVQDTSEINFTTTPERRRGLGEIGKGSGRGVLLHAMLGVDAETGGILGMDTGWAWPRAGYGHATAG